MRHGLLSFIASGFRFLWIQNTFLFRNYWATAARRQKMTFFAEVTLAIGWRVVFLMLVPSWSALALLVVGFLAGYFFTAYWFAYGPLAPYAQSALQHNTNLLH